MTTIDTMQKMLDHYRCQQEHTEQLFNDQLEWLKNDLVNNDPHIVIASVEMHLNRLCGYLKSMDEMQAKITAITELESFKDTW